MVYHLTEIALGQDLSEPCHCFPRKVRLLHSRDFDRVFQQPLKAYGPGFLLLARSNSKGYARLGLAVSRKCSRSAVERNRIKRLAREAFRRFQSDLPAADYVVICRSGAPDQVNACISENLSALFSKVGRRICETP